MNQIVFKTMWITASFLSITIASMASVQAGFGHHVTQQCCPNCNHNCKLEAKQVEVEKKCYEVECETICVPRVVFPWQTGDCRWFPWSKKKSQVNPCDACDACDGGGCKVCTNCVHNGAEVRTIKVLKSKSYKCPECEYSWSVDDGPGCGCGASGCCGNAGCCDASCDSLPMQW
ncbi:hypothetical protein Q31b_49360 [Novipirellula aureliae]|uniref:Uncharacterized protein n=1 Tax=Novipirellula aureliae TaxID=2527966 RepID=A0A5C6DKP0_9BACT|nr:hypothetical protein [Novipirellula aureliae]TWU36654.1 hypothetical protein Q31b_49360 [Novipirellula aureliae]